MQGDVGIYKHELRLILDDDFEYGLHYFIFL